MLAIKVYFIRKMFLLGVELHEQILFRERARDQIITYVLCFTKTFSYGGRET